MNIALVEAGCSDDVGSDEFSLNSEDEYFVAPEAEIDKEAEAAAKLQAEENAMEISVEEISEESTPSNIENELYDDYTESENYFLYGAREPLICSDPPNLSFVGAREPPVGSDPPKLSFVPLVPNSLVSNSSLVPNALVSNSLVENLDVDDMNIDSDFESDNCPSDDFDLNEMVFLPENDNFSDTQNDHVSKNVSDIDQENSETKNALNVLSSRVASGPRFTRTTL